MKGSFIEVYISKDKNNPSKGRKAVKVEVLEENAKTIIVKLRNGNVIKRRKDRDIV